MHGKNHSIIIVLYFLTALFCVIFIVLGFRFIKLWNASLFDGTHQFLLGTRGHDPAEVIIFRPDTQQIDTILFKGESDAANLFSSAGVFVDGVIPYNDLINPANFQLEKYLWLNLSNIQKKYTSLNIIDFLRLWLFERSIKENAGKTIVFTLPISQSANTTLVQVLTDKALYQEGETIAIINASTIYGEGSNVASALIATGVNVISVTTANNQENKSYISFSGKPTYTLQKLLRITHIPVISSQEPGGLADITIVLGEDIKSRLGIYLP